MPELREFTLNHEPPNGGVPPGTMFAQAGHPPSTIPPNNIPADNGPPDGGAPPGGWTPANGGNFGPPPPAYCPITPGHIVPTYWLAPGVVAMSSPPPLLLPPSPPAPPAPPASMPLHGYPNMLPGHMQTATHLHSPQPAPAYEPPGQYVDGHMLRGNGWSLISPTEHATVHFVGNGVRPCDYPYGYYPLQFPFSKHKVSCDMTVRELIKGLGCPPGPLHGITELILRGNDRFAAGDSFTQGGEASTKTLREVGWTCQKGEGKEVWLVVKK